MKKKLTAIFLCVALAAIAIVGASLAYFTDTKSATNTFTVGNVKIDLIDQQAALARPAPCIRHQSRDLIVQHKSKCRVKAAL